MENKAPGIFVFAGTTESREFLRALLERLKRAGCEASRRVHVFIATEYGGEILQEQFRGSASESLMEIHRGRLDRDGIYDALTRYKPGYAVDCTHPHALEISRNLQAACTEAGCGYLRLRRGTPQLPAGMRTRNFDNLEEAADFLRSQKGIILLATGSKELSPFAHPDLRDRVYLRVLPLEESLRRCRSLGFQGSHIIAMQGPFSEAMNRALLREIRAGWLVTKDSGTEGGLIEKLSAAAQEGAGVVMIRRPLEPEGLGAEEVLQALFPGAREKHVYLIGIGGGSEAGMTAEALAAIRNSRCVIAAPRLIAAAEPLIAGKPAYPLTGAEEIMNRIAEQECPLFAVLFSGDSGFYSGAKKLIPLLRERGLAFTVLPGVSSLSCFAARLGLSWDDAAVVSLHGRKAAMASPVLYNRKTFFLTGGETGPAVLCAALTSAGLGELTVHVGERLSYPDERIRSGAASSLKDHAFDGLSVVMVENPKPCSRGLGNYSLPDRAFTRGDVPMTKEEIRAVSLSKLRMEPDSIAWDVGAGTGSVACEMALKAREGRVYAVDHSPEALALLEENRKTLGLCNISAVCGSAPQALEALPSPDRVFIGGSSGELEPILAMTAAKNPGVRVVINGITIETASAALSLLKQYGFKNIDTVQIGVSRAELHGNVHLMKAINPVFIISGDGAQRGD
ncbi:MAG: precorrin-6A reductase [Treponema sp.]|jgi:precorrin-6Y C5,15-methyltransferase (decarboxylating)|nr:precorrin-6A reductase [Treponema sp.]